MTDEKLLNALISRLHSREMAALAFLTIASSASLVLLGFVKDMTEYWVIPIIGIFFPVLALAYNEVTRFTIHKHDHKWIRKIIDKDKENTFKSEEIIPFKEYRFTRMILTRTMLLIPVVGWILIMPLESIGEYDNCVRIFGIVGIIITIIVLSLKDRNIPKID